MSEALRKLPSLNRLLERRAVRGLLRTWSRQVVRGVAREVLDDQRDRIRLADAAPVEATLLRQCESELLARLDELARPQLRRVINATGVLLHTNLGRARIATAASAELARVASEPVELEVDLRSNRRGGRSGGVEKWLSRLTGAEASAVVNNGAAALWLAVRSCARPGRLVIVSRGEQVAIGGSFRMPELMRTTGAKMVEVGTTNRSSVADYAAVAGEGDVVLKVHPSNYRIEGFHEEAGLTDLARMCRERGAVLVFDAGSGSLYNFSRFGLSGEPPLAELVSAGPDLVTCSADKLLGGPQGGLIIGRAEFVDLCRRHPLMRALRLDKTILGALESTLLCYARTPTGALPDLPLFDALSVSVTELRRRARVLADRCAPPITARSGSGWSVAVVRSSAAMGAGSFANDGLKSIALEISAPDRAKAGALHRALRTERPAVLARIDDERVTLDLRAVVAGEIDELGSVLARALKGMPGGTAATGEKGR
jgi:L-seryl-tRNA(Ser) seleniumtransferase